MKAIAFAARDSDVLCDWSDDLLTAGYMRPDQMPRLVEGCAPADLLRRDLAQDAQFADAFAQWLMMIWKHGVGAAMAAYLAGE